MAINVPLVAAGKEMHKRLEKMKNGIQVGDLIWVTEEHIGIEHDMMFADGMWFTVVEKYEHHVVMERPLKRHGIHRQSIGYYDIYKFCEVRKGEKVWHRRRADRASR